MMHLSFRAAYAAAALAIGVLLSGCGNSSSNAVGSSLTPTSRSVSAVIPDKRAPQSPAEIWNGWVSPPNPSGPPPTDFEIILTGNVTNAIPNPPEPGYGVYDPFCPTSQRCNNIKVSYNPTSNLTTVAFTGSTLYQNIPGYAPLVHFGLLNGPGGHAVECFTRTAEWTFASAPPQPVPIVNFNPSRCRHHGSDDAKGNTVYATVYVEMSFSPITPTQPATAGGWYDIPYAELASGKQPKFAATNGGSQTIYTANAGIVLNEPLPSDPTCKKTLDCKGNIADLELLNFNDMPPPGSPSSPFITMEYPPPSQIPPASR